MSDPTASAPLDGPWWAAPADDDLRRVFAEPGTVGGDWVEAAVPGHWRDLPGLDDHDGPVLYRHAFEADAAAPGERAWLTLDGVVYQSDVWLDGAYLGPTEGYFVPHSFDVTSALRDGAEHLLAVDVACPPVTPGVPKRTLTGCLQDGELLPAGWNPGGFWRGVRLERTGPVRISRLSVVCLEADDERAIIELRATLDCTEAGEVDLRTLVDPAADRPGSGTVADEHNVVDLAAGANDVDWRFAVEHPHLWWPRALGDQPLYDLRIEAVVGGAVSHTRKRRTGLRQVELSDWILRVNGERLHLKGVVVGPARARLADVGPDELRGDVDLAADAGLDLLRLNAHVADPELYRHADRVGMLVWQELPAQREVARSIRREAARQARELVAGYGHHPSIAVWCGHNEPVPLADDLDDLGDAATRRSRLRRALVRQELPAVGRTVLDRGIRRALRQSDPSRPAIPHSGVLPHPPNFAGTDLHLWTGWYRGEERDLPDLAARLPRLVRFVTEFGAQAAPDHADFVDPSAWPELDWDRLAADHLLQRDLIERHTPVSRYAGFDTWREATQRYQARVVRFTVETLRRLKYRPSGGFSVFCLADAHPSIGFGLLDHERRPKLAWRALVDACRPVIVVADRMPVEVVAGQTWGADVHVVNDRRTPVGPCRVDAALHTAGWHRSFTWEGTIDADSVGFVGRAEAEVPGVPDGSRLRLDLTLHLDGGRIERTDDARVRS